MRVVLAALMFCLALSVPAAARHHHHRWHPHRHHARFVHRVVGAIGAGLIRVKLESGQVIIVAAAYAERFVGFLNALYRREGRLPPIGCYAPRGHMRGSLHHWGGACDVGQRARNVAWAPMYHVSSLAAEFGLTDGCGWRHPDCGHVDVSGVVGGRAFAQVSRHHGPRHRIARGYAATHLRSAQALPPKLWWQ